MGFLNGCATSYLSLNSEDRSITPLSPCLLAGVSLDSWWLFPASLGRTHDTFEACIAVLIRHSCVVTQGNWALRVAECLTAEHGLCSRVWVLDASGTGTRRTLCSILQHRRHFHLRCLARVRDASPLIIWHYKPAALLALSRQLLDRATAAKRWLFSSTDRMRCYRGEFKLGTCNRTLGLLLLANLHRLTNNKFN